MNMAVLHYYKGSIHGAIITTLDEIKSSLADFRRNGFSTVIEEILEY